MSYVMRKPVFVICDQQRCSQPAHRRFVVRCLDSIIICSFYIRNCKSLASFCGCAGRFESIMVANPEDRFSRDETHIIPSVCNSSLLVPTGLVIFCSWEYFLSDLFGCRSKSFFWIFLYLLSCTLSCAHLRKENAGVLSNPAPQKLDRLE